MSLIRKSPSGGKNSPDVTGLYDEATGSIQYVVSCPQTGKCALIDVVRDFDPASASIGTKNADRILQLVSEKGLEVEWVLDTHPHADHLMASSWLKSRTGAPNAIGEKVEDVARLWRRYYHLPDAFAVDKFFDHLFHDGDRFSIGNLTVRVMLTPGHTLASIAYLVGDDAAFVHDTFMQPDAGTSRADFPGGSAAVLYDSLQEILKLDDDTRLFIGHDYGTDERDEPQWESTVNDQRENNIHVGGNVSKSDYISKREERDATLPLPDRMLHVLQMNLRAGRLPPAEADDQHYLKIPLNRF